MDAQTTTIDIPTADGVADSILATPLAAGPHPGVLVYMDAFGLRPRLEEMASRIAGEGYAVLVPNVFYRSGRAPVVPLGNLRSAEDRAAMFDELVPLMHELTPERVVRDAQAYLDFLERDSRVSDGPMAAVGYCMGGALALRTGAQAPKRVAAVASFHGGRLATDRVDSPHLLVGQLAAEVYLGHADHDGSMPPEQQERLSEALSAAGVVHRAEVYEGAPHGFTMADTLNYDEAATERHWDRLLDLLARTLQR
jgi:carboxymethylenebutenolidase